ncbi:hypothetical protein [Campylobacter cuniculorum]|uniref:Transformation system protein n=2 Tax=Campylobacter cuniculorum TaxID=374106 RepID=A0A1W6BUI1_9BACT|nr:hypothetical protein [Campylobacter cuniculorum]ARJ55734.1 transformation system protein [Campylobacter cuniculorum DSM 23162 = LMG 24588]QOR04955.1 transformation system protein [Campylobacter cuniculorum]
MKKILCAFLCFGILNAQSDFKEYFSHLEKRFDIEFSKLHNPFSNPHLEQIYTLKIQAIFPDKVKINNAWYQQDDWINQAQIKSIESKQIILEYDNIIIPLKLKSNDKIYID